MNKIKSFLKTDLGQIISFIIIYSIIFMIFFSTLKLTLPFLIGLIVTSFLYKPTLKIMKKFKVKSGLASILSITIFYILFTIIIGSMGTLLFFELKNLIELLDTKTLMESVKNVFDGALGIYNGLDEDILSFINGNMSKMASSVSTALVTLGKQGLNMGIGFVSNIPYIITVIGFAVISTFFMLDNSVNGVYSKNKFINSKYFKLIKQCKDLIFRYVFSYALVLGSSFIEVFIMFLIAGVPNSFILSVICSILDILPIVGMAIIIIPMAIYYLLKGSYFAGIILIIGYVLICILRQIIEPKVMAKTLNISPLSSLIAIFVGLTANGFMGMIYCIFLVVFFNIIIKPKLKNN